MRGSRHGRLALAVLGALGAVAGCGGGDDSGGGTTASSSTTTTAPTTTTVTTAPAVTTTGAGRTLQVGAVRTAVRVPDQGASCPATVTAAGTIEATGSGSLTYVFTRSDGKAEPFETLEVSGPGPHEVTTQMTLGSPGASVTGWVALEVLSPQRVRSERAEISLTCGAAPPRTSPGGGGY